MHLNPVGKNTLIKITVYNALFLAFSSHENLKMYVKINIKYSFLGFRLKKVYRTAQLAQCTI